MESKDYTQWLNNEYTLWQNALKEAPFHKFKHNPAVIRMIGLTDLHREFIPLIEHLDLPWKELEATDQIGSPQYTVDINGVKLSGVCLRFIYYANRVLNVIDKMDSKRLAEIGAGYGGFYSVMALLAAHRNITIDHYTIFDLPEVLNFQSKYLRSFAYNNRPLVDNVSFMHSPDLSKFSNISHDYIMSFYALGEFDDATKNSYIENIISNVAQGLIIWNPHSGSDSSLDLLHSYHPSIKVKQEYPLTSINNQEVTW